MTTPKTMMIDGTKYIREQDAGGGPDLDTDGLPYVIVRSYNDGVKAGYLVKRDRREVTLRRARQLWQWNSAFVLIDLAEKGVNKSSGCKFSCELSQLSITLEACGLLFWTDKAGQTIRAEKAQEK